MSVLLAAPLLVAALAANPISETCEFEGIALHGRVKVVTSFPDIRVQIVDSFPGRR